MAEVFTPLTAVTLDGSLISVINTNFSSLATLLQDVHSRAGNTPNQMLFNLDMNSNRILNLPAPVSTGEPARLLDVVSNPTIVVPPTGTSGHTVPFLDGTNTWSGVNTFANNTSIGGSLSFNSGNLISWNNDTFLGRQGVATIQLGSFDSASPVAQILQVQNVINGTSNTAGQNFTIKGSAGTGTGAGGSIIFQTAPAGSSGSTQNILQSVVTIASPGNVLINTASGFSGNILELQSNALQKFYVDSSGNVNIGAQGGTVWPQFQRNSTTGGLNITVGGSGNPPIQLGSGDAAAPVAQTLQVQSVVAGTSNTVGPGFNIFGAKSTGNAQGGTIQFGVSLPGSSGTGQNAITNIWGITGFGHTLWNTDNTYDIGASGNSRPRNIYAGGAFFASNGVSIFTNGTSTSGNEFQEWKPSDWTAGKPYLFVKSSTGPFWTLGLWDGSVNTGTIGLSSSQLQVQGNIFQPIGTLTPTVGSTSGLGTTGTAVIQGAPNCVLVTLQPSGTGTASSGLFTLSWPVAWNTRPNVIVQAHNGTGTWQANPSFVITTSSTTQATIQWSNGATALTAGSTYNVTVLAIGH